MYKIAFHKKAVSELEQLDGSIKMQVLAAIKKVSMAPHSIIDGGYGKPLRGNLAGLFKIKLLKANIRIVYKVDNKNSTMVILVINERSNELCYELAGERRE